MATFQPIAFLLLVLVLGPFLAWHAAATEQTLQADECPSSDAITKQKPYNILFILTDQERYLSHAETPPTLHRTALASLQDRGITFTNHYINSVACSSSRSNIYTGHHIPRTRVFDNVNFPWQPDFRSSRDTKSIQTMGHVFRRAGYHTAYKGKWHLTHSFDRTIHEGMPLLSLDEHGFSDFMGLGDRIHHAQGGYHYDAMTVAHAVQWLRAKYSNHDQQAQSQQQQPWLLAVNLVNPHDIMHFNTDNDTAVVQGKESMADIAKAPPHATYQTRHHMPLPHQWRQPMDEPGRPHAHANYDKIYDLMVGEYPKDGNAERMQRYQDYYYNCLQDVDDHMGHLLQQINALGLTNHTIIIYTSDHGEMGGAHGLRSKGCMAYREQNHVPLVVVHPDHEGGKTCQAVTSHIDILPTMIGSSHLPEEIQSELGHGLPGHDMTPLLNNPEDAAHDTLRPNGALFTYNMLVTNMDPEYIRSAIRSVKNWTLPAAPRMDQFRGALRSVFDGRYKFTRYFFPKQHNLPTTLEEIVKYNDMELFDHSTDPHETINLAAVNPEQHRELIETLNAKMNALIQEEIGDDNGQMLPFGKTLIDWSIPKQAMAGI